MSELLRAHVPGCLAPELRQPIDALAKNQNVFIDATTTNPVETVVQEAMELDGETPSDFHDAAQLTGDLAAVVIASFIKIGTLAGTLARGGTQTLNVLGGGTVTVDGYFIPDRTPAVVAPSGARCGAVKFSGTWYAIVIDQCVAEA